MEAVRDAKHERSSASVAVATTARDRPTITPKDAAVAGGGSEFEPFPQDLDDIFRRLPPRARAFLLAYQREDVLTHVGAAKIVGCHPKTHTFWMRTADGYRECYQAVDAAVNAQLEAMLLERALHGTAEDEYDGDGNLRRRRVRHDSSWLKMVLAGKMPERYGNGGTNPDSVNVRVVFRSE